MQEEAAAWKVRFAAAKKKEIETREHLRQADVLANLESANRAQAGIAQTNVEKAKSALNKCTIETNKVSEQVR